MCGILFSFQVSDSLKISQCKHNLKADGLFTVRGFVNYLGFNEYLPVEIRKIKAKPILSVIYRNAFILMSAVLFMSAASIRGSSGGVLYCSTHLWIIAPDYIVSPLIINTDMCLLSISGTCRAGIRTEPLTTINYANRTTGPLKCLWKSIC